jgi:hypothetical protein
MNDNIPEFVNVLFSKDGTPVGVYTSLQEAEDNRTSGQIATCYRLSTVFAVTRKKAEATR